MEFPVLFSVVFSGPLICWFLLVKFLPTLYSGGNAGMLFSHDFAFAAQASNTTSAPHSKQWNCLEWNHDILIHYCLLMQPYSSRVWCLFSEQKYQLLVTPAQYTKQLIKSWLSLSIKCSEVVFALFFKTNKKISQIERQFVSVDPVFCSLGSSLWLRDSESESSLQGFSLSDLSERSFWMVSLSVLSLSGQLRET